MQLQSAGIELYAAVEGEGEPLLFLHGGLADHRASMLHVGGWPYRRILPDLRGSGRSHYHGELSWDLWTEDVRAWLDALELRSAVVGGVSMGSGVAAAFALRYPERVRALLLVWPVYGEPLREAQASALRTMHTRAQRGMEGLVPLFARLPDAVRERALAMLRGFDPESVVNTTRFLATLEQPFALADLAALRMPTFVVPGLDPEHPAELAESYARTIPNARLLQTLGDWIRAPVPAVEVDE